MNQKRSVITLNDETSLERRQLTWKSLLFATVLVMSVALVVVLVAIRLRPQGDPPPQVVRPGEIIDSAGEYQLPGGRVMVSLTPTGTAGEIQWKASSNHASSAMNVDSFSDWFSAIDQYEGVWLFNSKHGVHVWHETPGGGGRTTAVGVGGGWQGVPDKLPEQHRAYYETWAKNQGLWSDEEGGGLPAGETVD